MTSPDSKTLPPKVQQLSTGSTSGQRNVYFLKITDACLTALKSRPSVASVSIKDADKGGEIDLGDDRKFAFNCFAQSGYDAVLNIAAGDSRSLHSIPVHHKFTVTADEQQSFAQTKQRADQLQRESKNSSARDITNKSTERRLNKRLNKAGASSSTSESNLLGADSNKSAKSSYKPSSTGGGSPSESLRQRVIQQLAIQPMTKNKLCDRLQRDGLGEATNRTVLDTVIAQCSKSSDSSESGRLRLRRELWSQVRVDDWPGYSSVDKSTVQSNKNSILKRGDAQPAKAESAGSGTAASSSSNLIPALNTLKASSSARAMVTSGKRRAPVTTDVVAPSSAPKLPKTATDDSTGDAAADVNGDEARPKQQANPTATTTAPAAGPPDKPDTPPPEDPNQEHVKKSWLQRTAHSAHKPKAPAAPARPVGQQNGQPSNNTTTDPMVDMPKVQLPDFQQLLPPINSVEQYARYRHTFTKEYKLYMAAYKEIKKVAESFAALGRQLETHTPGTTEHKRIENEITDRFTFYQTDANFIKHRKQHVELREKLSVIKERVRDYEERVANGGGVEAAANAENGADKTSGKHQQTPANVSSSTDTPAAAAAQQPSTPLDDMFAL